MMQDFLNKKIVVGISGGIAAYKTAELIRELTRAGAQVRVVMTRSSQQFITPMTFQALTDQEVRSELFDSQAERAMGHIELARWADYLLIAPATANIMAKMAQGIADDLLSTLYLVSETPVIVCPAMNRSMWAHSSTQHNYELLKSRGVIFCGPEEGSQACGDYGFGRMSGKEPILNSLRLCGVEQLLCGYQFLITAGPTREPLDPVRYLSNRSSGKMGYALAQAASMAGAKVTLITGPTHLPPPQGVETVAVETGQEMYHAVMQHLQKGMVFIGAAAVADYHYLTPAVEKMKKSGVDGMSLELHLNKDILTEVAASGKAFTIGFAAETNDVLINAKEKLERKKLDMIIANQVGKHLGFDQDEHQATILTANEHIPLPREHKTRLAGKIITMIAAHLKNTSKLKEKYATVDSIKTT